MIKRCRHKWLYQGLHRAYGELNYRWIRVRRYWCSKCGTIKEEHWPSIRGGVQRKQKTKFIRTTERKVNGKVRLEYLLRSTDKDKG